MRNRKVRLQAGKRFRPTNNNRILIFAALGGAGSGLGMAIAGAPAVDAGSFGLALAAGVLMTLQQRSDSSACHRPKGDGGTEQNEAVAEVETGKPEKG
ncbi:hypothetical protein [Streptomyces erythrochromogenes]|uniref:hypothetical protein n=1 Tax=Streptomyces erythrochromogenes TaxID=285574 RepID=UPI0036B29DF5